MRDAMRGATRTGTRTTARVARGCLPAAVAAALAAAATAAAPGALAAQEDPPPRQIALAPEARFLPLETVREGVVRMPKALARTVSVRRDSVPLQQVLVDIATQAGLGLSYGENLSRSRTLVSLDLARVSAAEALAAAVRHTEWSVLVNAA